MLRGDPNPRYEIRWDEGTSSIYSPANGGIQLDPAYKGKKKKPSAKKD